jgi:hypothetical protein
MLSYNILKVTDKSGNVWHCVVEEMGDSVCTYGLTDEFESEAYHLSCWCAEKGFTLAVKAMTYDTSDM